MLQDFAQKLANDIHQAMENGPTPHSQLQQIISSAVKRLNLVGRDEFDAQSIVLQRSREKIDALEQQLTQMQQQLEQLQNSSNNS
ncbi:MAG: accessory factor UbiK family protein [Cellvibrionaceae bacterium]|nr:accessory factor UbiK family protein [Cellvibrionaceae bacterium]